MAAIRSLIQRFAGAPAVKGHSFVASNFRLMPGEIVGVARSSTGETREPLERANPACSGRGQGVGDLPGSVKLLRAPMSPETVAMTAVFFRRHGRVVHHIR